MKHNEFPIFFGALAKAFVEQTNFYKSVIDHGLDPNFWPDCDAKPIAIAFHEMAKSKSVEYAKVYSKTKTDRFSEYDIPEYIDELVCVFNEFKKYGLAVQLASRIKEKPFSVEQLISDFRQNKTTSVISHLVKEEIVDYGTAHIKASSEGKKHEVAITNWPLLSQMIGGFNPGRIILIAAQTGKGKTSLALNLTIDAARTMPVYFFNMEMIIDDIFDRLIQITGEITRHDWMNIPSNTIAERAGFAARELIGMNNFFITNGKSLTLEEICSEIIIKSEEHGIKLFVVDYDQKIRTNYKFDEWQALQKAIEELEQVAMSTNSCIIVLSQANEHNLPRASSRIMQTASAVLSFYEENGNFYIEGKKTRFNQSKKLDISVDFSILKFKENDFFIEAKPCKKQIVRDPSAR